MHSDSLLAIEKNFRKRIRIAAENPKGKYSSVWMFWGQGHDFYFGAKTLLQSFKVSLHKNGIGYVAYDRQFRTRIQNSGISLPSKSISEWRFPTPATIGAVHLAVVRLPADFCTHGVTPSIQQKKTLVLGVEEGCAAEIGVFASYEDMQTLEDRFLKIGNPLFAVRLDNGVTISIVVRSTSFDPSILPTSDKLNHSKRIEFVAGSDIQNKDNLNMIVWNRPGDGEALQVVDIGGVRILPH